MKRFAVMAAKIALVLVLAANPVGSGAGAGETDAYAGLSPVTIKVGNGASLKEFGNQLYENWMKAVTEKSGGKIIFDYYPGGQLGGLVEMIEQVDYGVIHMAKSDPSLFDSYVAEFSLLYNPFLIKDYDHAFACIYGEPGDILANLMEERTNTKIIGYYLGGVRNFATTRPIRNLADCNGLIMRSPESQIYMDTFKLIGMSPTPIAYSEMYTALQTGVVQGMEGVPDTIYEVGFHKIAPNVCKSNHMFCFSAATVNKDFWRSLPEAYRKLMVETFDAMKDSHNLAVIEIEQRAYAGMKADNTNITEWDNFDEITAVARPYWIASAKKYGAVGEKLYQAIMKALK